MGITEVLGKAITAATTPNPEPAPPSNEGSLTTAIKNVKDQLPAEQYNALKFAESKLDASKLVAANATSFNSLEVNKLNKQFQDIMANLITEVKSGKLDINGLYQTESFYRTLAQYSVPGIDELKGALIQANTRVYGYSFGANKVVGFDPQVEQWLRTPVRDTLTRLDILTAKGAIYGKDWNKSFNPLNTFKPYSIQAPKEERSGIWGDVDSRYAIRIDKQQKEYMNKMLPPSSVFAGAEKVLKDVGNIPRWTINNIMEFTSNMSVGPKSTYNMLLDANTDDFSVALNHAVTDIVGTAEQNRDKPVWDRFLSYAARTVSNLPSSYADTVGMPFNIAGSIADTFKDVTNKILDDNFTYINAEDPEFITATVDFAKQLGHALTSAGDAAKMFEESPFLTAVVAKGLIKAPRRISDRLQTTAARTLVKNVADKKVPMPQATFTLANAIQETFAEASGKDITKLDTIRMKLGQYANIFDQATDWFVNVIGEDPRLDPKAMRKFNEVATTAYKANGVNTPAFQKYIEVLSTMNESSLALAYAKKQSKLAMYNKALKEGIDKLTVEDIPGIDAKGNVLSIDQRKAVLDFIQEVAKIDAPLRMKLNFIFNEKGSISSSIYMLPQFAWGRAVAWVNKLSKKNITPQEVLDQYKVAKLRKGTDALLGLEHLINNPNTRDTPLKLADMKKLLLANLNKNAPYTTKDLNISNGQTHEFRFPGYAGSSRDPEFGTYMFSSVEQPFDPFKHYPIGQAMPNNLFPVSVAHNPLGTRIPPGALTSWQRYVEKPYVYENETRVGPIGIEFQSDTLDKPTIVDVPISVDRINALEIFNNEIMIVNGDMPKLRTVGINLTTSNIKDIYPFASDSTVQYIIDYGLKDPVGTIDIIKNMLQEDYTINTGTLQRRQLDLERNPPIHKDNIHEISFHNAILHNIQYDIYNRSADKPTVVVLPSPHLVNTIEASSVPFTENRVAMQYKKLNKYIDDFIKEFPGAKKKEAYVYFADIHNNIAAKQLYEEAARMGKTVDESFRGTPYLYGHKSYKVPALELDNITKRAYVKKLITLNQLTTPPGFAKFIVKIEDAISTGNIKQVLPNLRVFLENMPEDYTLTRNSNLINSRFSLSDVASLYYEYDVQRLSDNIYGKSDLAKDARHVIEKIQKDMHLIEEPYGTDLIDGIHNVVIGVNDILQNKENAIYTKADVYKTMTWFNMQDIPLNDIVKPFMDKAFKRLESGLEVEAQLSDPNILRLLTDNKGATTLHTWLIDALAKTKQRVPIGSDPWVSKLNLDFNAMHNLYATRLLGDAYYKGDESYRTVVKALAQTATPYGAFARFMLLKPSDSRMWNEISDLWFKIKYTEGEAMSIAAQMFEVERALKDPHSLYKAIPAGSVFRERVEQLTPQQRATPEGKAMIEQYEAAKLIYDELTPQQQSLVDTLQKPEVVGSYGFIHKLTYETGLIGPETYHGMMGLYAPRVYLWNFFNNEEAQKYLPFFKEDTANVLKRVYNRAMLKLTGGRPDKLGLQKSGQLMARSLDTPDYTNMIPSSLAYTRLTPVIRNAYKMLFLEDLAKNNSFTLEANFPGKFKGWSIEKLTEYRDNLARSLGLRYNADQGSYLSIKDIEQRAMELIAEGSPESVAKGKRALVQAKKMKIRSVSNELADMADDWVQRAETFNKKYGDDPLVNEQLANERNTLFDIDPAERLRKELDIVSDIVNSFHSVKELHKGELYQVPTTRIASGQFKYGNLAGKYVDKYEWHQINEVLNGQPVVMTWLSKLLQPWKIMKVADSPSTQMNNITWNWLTAYLGDAGISPFNIPFYISVANDIKTKPQMYREFAARTGATGFFEDAIVYNKLLYELKKMQINKANTGHIVKAVQKTFLGLTAAQLKIADKYQGVETFFKYSIYKRLREKGLTDKEAFKKAQGEIFNYNDVTTFNKWFRVAPFVGAPFSTFYFKLWPLMLKTALTNPHKVLILYGIKEMMNMTAMSDMTEDEKKKFMQNLPPGYNKSTAVVIPSHLGSIDLTGPNGNRMVLNPANQLPFANINQRGPFQEVADETIEASLGEQSIAKTLSTAMSPMMPGQDPFAKTMDILKNTPNSFSNQPNRIGTRLRAFAQLWLPSFTPSWGTSFEKMYHGTADRFTGERMPRWVDYSSSIFGLQLQEYRDNEFNLKMKSLVGELRQLEADLKSYQRNKGNRADTEKYNKQVEYYQKRIKQKQENMESLKNKYDEALK